MERACVSTGLKLDAGISSGRLLQSVWKERQADIICGCGSLKIGRKGSMRSLTPGSFVSTGAGLMKAGGFSPDRLHLNCSSSEDRLKRGGIGGGPEDVGQSCSRPKIITPKLRVFAADDMDHQPEENETTVDIEDREKGTTEARQIERLLVGRPKSKLKSIAGIESPYRRRTASVKQARFPLPWKFRNLAEEWANFTGPRENGDVRDVVLMSLSFAVLVYISQHLVHAYCMLRHLYKL